MPNLTKAEKAANQSANESRRRKEAALAEMRELDLACRKGELLEVEAVHSTWFETCSRIRERMMSIPDRVAEELAGKPADVVRNGLIEAIEEALKEIGTVRKSKRSRR